LTRVGISYIKTTDRNYCRYGGAGERLGVEVPSLFVSGWWMWNSPYINHFISADTVIPSYTNPQDLNRYSYVNNNPLRYADPSGHMQVDNQDMQKNHASMNCSKYPQYCSNGKKKSKQELNKMRNHGSSQKEMRGGFADLFPGGIAGSWGPPNDIDPADFNELLGKIRTDVHETPSALLVLKSPIYDTPFYNRNGKYTGTGCLNGKCYDRSELNYVGEGELWAGLGFTKDRTHGIVSAWKAIYGHSPSQGTIEMTDIGFDHYQELYPPAAPGYNYIAPFIMIPQFGGDS